MATESERADARPCERCGGPAGFEVGGRWVCEECYSLAGSCCLEFGADDLWKEREGDEARKSLPVDAGR